MTDPLDQSSLPPTAPPTAPGPLRGREWKSNWPTVLGVFAMVLASLGLFGGACGVFSMVGFSALQASSQTAPGSAPGSQPATYAYSYTVLDAEMGLAWRIGLIGINLLLAIALLVAGIGLLKRSRWSMTASRVWAVTKIVFVMVCGVIAAMNINEQVAATQQQQVGAGPPPGAYEFFAWIGMFFGVGIPLIFPVIMLVWLARPKIRNEVRTW